MMAIKILGRYRDQAGTACQAALATGGEASKARRIARLDRISATEPAGAALGAGNCSQTVREAWGFGAWCAPVNI
jgi:hypothetical protein